MGKYPPICVPILDITPMTYKYNKLHEHAFIHGNHFIQNYSLLNEHIRLRNLHIGRDTKNPEPFVWLVLIEQVPDNIIVMELPNFRLWYKTILRNNGTEIEGILCKADTEMINSLVNEELKLEPMDSETLPLTKLIAKYFEISYPLQIAVVYGKKEAFEVLVKYGGNILLVDKFDNNILHLMCYVINGNPEREEEARVFYRWLVRNISQEHISCLLAGKNLNNVNPETTAVALGSMGLFLDFLKTRGRYISRIS